MAKRKKKGINLIALIFVLIIIVFVIIGITKFLNKRDINNINNTTNVEQNQEKYVKVLDNGTKLNTSDKLNEDKKIEDLEIKDIQLTYKNGVTNILAIVENKSDSKIEMQEVEIHLLDENKNIIYKMTGIIESLEPGETKQLNSSITADFANVYNFEIVKK